ncbi:LANO_0G04764g1_1 [Lachancea nothofagi CBS 11611]|uniref:LANO_0G04764g1_1 n=1 Tax=Lachancea nothofagi CBS 11611 TaxID=1266666 RepID=A0A1G4KGC1_9SACH|nr:LANO_0G04764g1_1 [Lachancea nothofagi CBS 11611]
MESKNRPSATSTMPLDDLPVGLLQEILSFLPQQDRLTVCLVSRKFNHIATKLVYRRIYLNDSNVVRSDIMNLAINWTLLFVPNRLPEQYARKIADRKLRSLIQTLQSNDRAVQSVEWVRINWDLDPKWQKMLLSVICNESCSLQRLENVTDPSCNDIIAHGRMSSQRLTSFDMAPPNPNAGSEVDPSYIPNLKKYLSQRISSRITFMNLFINPQTLFTHLYPLRDKLQIVDLKLHWRVEFYPKEHFAHDISERPLHKLSDIFDTRSLKVLTIVSWHECLLPSELEMLQQFKEFTNVEDLSLISIEQEPSPLIGLFTSLSKLRRLKIDFIEQLSSQSTKPELFLAILHCCRELEFLDMRFEGLDAPIVDVENGDFRLTQKCYCSSCMHVFESILRQKLFLFPEDYVLADFRDVLTKDIFRMIRFHCLLPYSKACDYYPSVRTYPMDMEKFVYLMNNDLKLYRASRCQLVRDPISSETNDHYDRCRFDVPESPSLDDLFDSDDENTFADMALPHKLLTREDVVQCYHALIHHHRRTYIALLTQFPRLKFLVLNDIATVVVSENDERVLQPVFYNEGFVSNLRGWTQKGEGKKNSKVFVEKSAFSDGIGFKSN